MNEKKQRAIRQLAEDIVKTIDHAKATTGMAIEKVQEYIEFVGRFMPPRIAMKILFERMDDVAWSIVKRLRCALNTAIWDGIRNHFGGKDCSFWETDFGKKLYNNEDVGLAVHALAETVAMVYFDEAAKRHADE